MARLNKQELLEIIVSAVNECGWNLLYISDRHPFILQIYRGTESHRVRIYIWNISHGGGAARPANEYRIQVTGIVSDHFIQSPSEKTLILGWRNELGVFAGFDIRRHSRALGFSPSFQIREECLEQAVVNGFAPCDKGNQEIAIAFRPDFIVEYIRNLEQLHNFGESTADLAILEEVAQNPDIAVNDQDIPIQDTGRRTAVVTINKKMRDVNFTRRVLLAYQYRCAFCGLQLRLIDAAHIIPVNHENSVDQTSNGLSLCALHHRAYDRAFVTVNENYNLVINNLKATELANARLIDGYEWFSANIRNSIITPEVLADRPHVEYIRIGNQIRGWKPEQLQ